MNVGTFLHRKNKDKNIPSNIKLTDSAPSDAVKEAGFSLMKPSVTRFKSPVGRRTEPGTPGPLSKGRGEEDGWDVLLEL